MSNDMKLYGIFLKFLAVLLLQFTAILFGYYEHFKISLISLLRKDFK